MARMPDIIELGPEEEARRLWSGALEARKAAADDVVPLCESLGLGLHAAEILVIRLLQPIKDQFPATIGVQLNMPTPEVDPHRDAITVPKMLEFIDVVDLLSGEELECVSPGLHRGWEDRRFSCRRSRAAAQGAIGLTLSADDQERLLLLAAYRNRLFRSPPPVRLVPGEILSAFQSLERLVEGLLKAAG
ncbi:MAG: hypothetical protein GTO46_10065 [Gemmatimonadetes bacterium]|nr:hypothetical protein [Gemmatimonadota bacterium]NIO31948.1 hypothetical protein [Gemmatimonadota bacterium]